MKILQHENLTVILIRVFFGKNYILRHFNFLVQLFYFAFQAKIWIF